MTFDSRWKNPQGSDPKQLSLWAQDLIKELRKGAYLSATEGDIAGLDARITALEAGPTLIASGSLSGTAVNITNIPQTFSYLVLQTAGLSFNAPDALLVQLSTNNGSSYDTTANNYLPSNNTGGIALASMFAPANLTAAQLMEIGLTFFGYRVGSQTTAFGTFRVASVPTTNISVATYFGSTDAINAMRLMSDAGANFDAGTYALYGVR